MIKTTILLVAVIFSIHENKYNKLCSLPNSIAYWSSHVHPNSLRLATIRSEEINFAFAIPVDAQQYYGTVSTDSLNPTEWAASKGYWESKSNSKGICDSAVCSLGVVVCIKEQRAGAGAPRILQSFESSVKYSSCAPECNYRVRQSPNGDSNTFGLVQAGVHNLFVC